MLFSFRQFAIKKDKYKNIPLWLGLLVGAILGFISGIVGIGGGIFLAPILYFFRAGSPKEIAASASLFILVNSISGLSGQLQKNGLSEEILSFWYLPFLVLIGGQIGNILTVKIIPQQIIALFTALLVLFVAARLALIII